MAVALEVRIGDSYTVKSAAEEPIPKARERAQVIIGGSGGALTLSVILFWDSDPAKLDAARHAAHIVQRVVERGSLADWRATRRYYGDAEMIRIVTTARYLSARTRKFCAAAFKLQDSDFRCYSNPPFPPTPWMY